MNNTVRHVVVALLAPTFAACTTPSPPDAGDAGNLAMDVVSDVPLATDGSDVTPDSAPDAASDTVMPPDDASPDGGASCATCSIVASGAFYVTDLASDGTNVYWSELEQGASPPYPASIVRAPVAGGTTVMLAPATWPRDIVIDSSNVYWAETGSADGSPTTMASLVRVALTGGTPVIIADHLEYVGGNFGGWSNALVVDDTNVYFSSRRSGMGAISRVAKSATAPGTDAMIAIVPGPALVPNSASLVGTRIYFTVNGASTIYSVATSGGTPSSDLIQTLPYAIAAAGVDGWVTGNLANMATLQHFTLASPSSATAVYMMNGAEVSDVVSDGAHVYWLEFNRGVSGRVMRAGLDGSSATAIAEVAGDGEMHRLSVDATSVYFAYSTGSAPDIASTIFRAPK